MLSERILLVNTLILLSIRSRIMNISRNSRLTTVSACILFALVSWALLYFWLSLVHTVEEKVATTVPASPLVYLMHRPEFFFLIIQRKPGALRELAIVTLSVFVMLIYIVFSFNMLMHSKPDIYDLIFYYECFLMIFFCGTPLYLSMRMI